MLKRLCQAALLLTFCGTITTCVAQERWIWIYLSDHPLSKNSDASDNAEAVAWFATYDETKSQFTFESAYSSDNSPKSDRYTVTAKKLKELPVTEIREFWTRAENIVVGFVSPKSTTCPDNSSRIDLTEVARPSAIQAGWTSLEKALLPKPSGAPKTLTEPTVCISTKQKTLSATRANLGITLDKDVKDSKDKTALNVITGPTEHWFLSGDVVTSAASQLTFDPTTNSVTEKKKPTSVYLGLNYMLGDVYSRQAGFWTPDRIVFRMQVLGSKSPFDSYGVGLGYRFGDFDDAKTTGGFMVFVSSLWTKGDDSSNTSLGTKQSWRLGIAYSLDAALGWLGK